MLRAPVGSGGSLSTLATVRPSSGLQPARIILPAAETAPSQAASTLAVRAGCRRRRFQTAHESTPAEPRGGAARDQVGLLDRVVKIGVGGNSGVAALGDLPLIARSRRPIQLDAVGFNRTPDAAATARASISKVLVNRRVIQSDPLAGRGDSASGRPDWLDIQRGSRTSGGKEGFRGGVLDVSKAIRRRSTRGSRRPKADEFGPAAVVRMGRLAIPRS